jgi:hypothetical protein
VGVGLRERPRDDVQLVGAGLPVDAAPERELERRQRSRRDGVDVLGAECRVRDEGLVVAAGEAPPFVGRVFGRREAVEAGPAVLGSLDLGIAEIRDRPDQFPLRRVVVHDVEAVSARTGLEAVHRHLSLGREDPAVLETHIGILGDDRQPVGSRAGHAGG